jgi:hypothetical protein
LPPFSIASLKELTWRLKLPSSEAQLGLKFEFEVEVEVDMLNRRFGVVVVGRNEAVRNAGLRWVNSLSELLFINAMKYAVRERTVKQRDVEENEWVYISRGDPAGRSCAARYVIPGRSIDDQRISRNACMWGMTYEHKVCTTV